MKSRCDDLEKRIELLINENNEIEKERKESKKKLEKIQFILNANE